MTPRRASSQFVCGEGLSARCGSHGMNDVDHNSYFYRVRGRTLGPVPLRQMRQLAQRAQIGRTTDVSRDGTQWGKAADWPEIFDAGGGADPGFGLGPPVDPLAGAYTTPATITTNASQWYYARGGVQKGPVDLSTLQQMVATGQLTGSDHVFPDGSDDWLTVSSVPLLNAGTITGMPVVNVNVPTGSSISTDGTNGLAIAGFILSLIGCAPLGLILSLVALSGKNKANRGLAIAGAIIGGLLTLCGCGYVVLVFLAAAANA